ncbi:MAG: hypothetical protein WC523_00035 [Patescibacteria group bacterium]
MAIVDGTDRNYRDVLSRARVNGEAHDFRHCQGWHAPKKTTMLDLYRTGRASVEQALAHNAKPKDHVAALEWVANAQGQDAMFAFAQKLVAHGIDVHKLESTRKATMTRQVNKLTAENERLVRTARKPVITIRKVVAGKSVERVVLSGTPKPVTQRDIESAESVAIAEKYASLKAQLDKLKATPRETVGALSQEQLAEIARRNASKGRPIVK